MGRIRNWVRVFPLYLRYGLESNFLEIEFIELLEDNQLRLCGVIAIKIESI